MVINKLVFAATFTITWIICDIVRAKKKQKTKEKEKNFIDK